MRFTPDQRQSCIEYILLAIFVVAGTFVATNPEARFPLIFEAIAVGCMFFWTGMQVRKSQKKMPSLLARQFIVVALIVAGLGIAALFSMRSSACYFAGSWWYKLECMAQSSALINPAVRQFSTTIAAVGIFFLATFGMLHSTKRSLKALPIILALMSVSVILIGEVYYFSFGTRILPIWAGVAEFNDWWGLAGIFTNYGWVWPYLAPGLVVGVTLLVAGDQEHERALGASIFVLYLPVVLVNQQRGFLLLYTIFSLIFIYMQVKSSLNRKWLLKCIIIPVLLVVFIFALALVLSTFFGIENFIAKAADRALRKLSVPISRERLELWWFGLKKTWDNPWGHGYGSWYKINSDAFQAKDVSIAFDTPHNLLIELLVEFGVLPTLLILTVIVGFIRTAYKNAVDRFNRLLVIFTCIALTLCLAVQELTYIRATYLFWSAFLGGIYGMILAMSAKDAAVTSAWWSRRLCFAGIACWFFATIVARWFPFNGFAFEPASQPGFAVERWMGGIASVKAPPSLVPKWSLFSADLVDIGPEQRFEIDRLVLEKPNRSPFWIPIYRHYNLPEVSVKTELLRKDAGRRIGFKLRYPMTSFVRPVTWTYNATLVGEEFVNCDSIPCLILIQGCRTKANARELTFEDIMPDQAHAWIVREHQPFNLTQSTEQFFKGDLLFQKESETSGRLQAQDPNTWFLVNFSAFEGNLPIKAQVKKCEDQ